MIKVKGSGGGVNIKKANAAPGDVMKGKTFFSGVSGEMQVGTYSIYDNLMYTYSGAATETITDTTISIKLTSSGTFKALVDFDAAVSLSGGGGGGGNGAKCRESVNSNKYLYATGGAGGKGYTTSGNVSLSASTEHTITIGAGGAIASTGGTTSAFNLTANGGGGGGDGKAGYGVSGGNFYGTVNGSDGVGGDGAAGGAGGNLKTDYGPFAGSDGYAIITITKK